MLTTPDNDGCTALMAAAEGGSGDIFEAALKPSRDVFRKDGKKVRQSQDGFQLMLFLRDISASNVGTRLHSNM